MFAQRSKGALKGKVQGHTFRFHTGRLTLCCFETNPAFSKLLKISVGYIVPPRCCVAHWVSDKLLEGHAGISHAANKKAQFETDTEIKCYVLSAVSVVHGAVLRARGTR